MSAYYLLFSKPPIPRACAFFCLRTCVSRFAGAANVATTFGRSLSLSPQIIDRRLSALVSGSKAAALLPRSLSFSLSLFLLSRTALRLNQCAMKRRGQCTGCVTGLLSRAQGCSALGEGARDIRKHGRCESSICLRLHSWRMQSRASCQPRDACSVYLCLLSVLLLFFCLLLLLRP